MMSGGELVSDVARHFIERWLFSRADSLTKNSGVPALLPTTMGVVNAGGGPNLCADGIVGLCSSRLDFSNPSSLNGQILRSGSAWSLGTSTERSIYNAMLRLIEGAGKCIYIENQYFCAGFGDGSFGDFDEGLEPIYNMTPSGGGGGGGYPGRETDGNLSGNHAASSPQIIVNGIAGAIFSRISKAIDNDERFRVMVVMPHLCWEHNPVQSTIMHFQNASIKELLRRLGEKYPAVENWEDYISFYNLRKHGEMDDGREVMEEIYLHDKLMIVDDRTVLLGSANINDRSLLGERDSEVAVLLYDVETIETVMDGKKWEAGSFAHGLRCRLWREHLGLLNVVGEEGKEGLGSGSVDLTDPFGEAWNVWRYTATNNRRIYEHCFPTMYRDEYTKLKNIPNYNTYKEEVNPSAEEGENLKQVKGHLVTAAPYFLSQENILPGVGTKAFLMPRMMFV
jgi:phospholipase D1/2